MTRPFGYNCLLRQTAAKSPSLRLPRICEPVRKIGQRAYVLKRSSLARKRSQSRQHENSHQERAQPQVSLVARKPQVALVARQPSQLALSRTRRTRSNIIPFRASLGAVRGRTEQLVATIEERTALWHSIQRDVRENRKAHREGKLVPFAYPEHAHAAYESLLESLDTVLRRYRTLYGEMLDEFEFLWQTSIGRQHQDYKARRQRIYGIFKYLRQQRGESYQLTTELKDLAKVTHSIITRDALFFEHVTRLTAFKQNFHTVSRGWDGIKRVLYREGDRSTHWVQRKLRLKQINMWRSEVSAGKAAVKKHLDKQLRLSDLPLFHMKRAIDFFHDLMRRSSATVFDMEDIALFYQTEGKKWPPYKSKYLWISACLDTLRTQNNESASVFRGVAFYIAAHVRHKYGLTSSDETTKHVSELPLYVLHGLAIEEHRAAMGPVPYPKLRPGSSGLFPEVHTDQKGYPIMEDLYHTEEIGRAIEVPELAAVEDTPQATSIDTQDHAPGSAILEATDAQQDAGMLWDDYDLPDVDDISFPSSHERVQDFHYGHMIRQRKSTLEMIRSQPEGHMEYGHLDAVATYATLFRQQVARLNEQNIDPGSRSMDASSLPPVAVPQAWQSAYRRRSRLRPQKYGDMLRQFQGLPASTDTYQEPEASSRAQAGSHARSAVVKDSYVAESSQVLPRIEAAPPSVTDEEYSAAPIRSALGSVLDDFLYPDASARIRGDRFQVLEERFKKADTPLVSRYGPKNTPASTVQNGFRRLKTVPVAAISPVADSSSPISEPHSSSSPVVGSGVSSSQMVQEDTSSSPAVTPLRKQLDTLHLHIEGLIKIKLELEKLHAKETQPVVLTADSHVVSASPLDSRDDAASVPGSDPRLTRTQRRAALRPRQKAFPRQVQSSHSPNRQQIGLVRRSGTNPHWVPPQKSATELEQGSSLHDGSMSTGRGQDAAASVPHLHGPLVTRTPGVAGRSPDSIIEEKLHAKETQSVVLTADSHVVSASPLEPRDGAAPVPSREDLYDTHQKRSAARLLRRDQAREHYEARIPQEPTTEPKQKDGLLENNASFTSRRRLMDIQQEPAAEPEQESGSRNSSSFTSLGKTDAASESSPDSPLVRRTSGTRRSRVRSSRSGRDDTSETSQVSATEHFEVDDHSDDGLISIGRARVPNIPRELTMEPEKRSDLHDSSESTGRGHTPDTSQEPAIESEPQSRLDTSHDLGTATLEIGASCPNCFRTNDIRNTSCEKCSAPLIFADSTGRTRRIAWQFWTRRHAESAARAAKRSDAPTSSFEGLFERELFRRAGSDNVVPQSREPESDKT